MTLRLAREGDVDAQVAAAKLYLSGGAGVSADPRAALYWLRQAAQQGDLEARRLIADRIPESLVAQPEELLSYYVAPLAEPSPNADVTVSDWLLSGQLKEANSDSSALSLLQRAAEAGDRRAQLRLALLLKGRGKAFAEEAFRWFARAAEQGSRAAALELMNWHWERHDSRAGLWSPEPEADAGEEHLYRTAVLRAGAGDTQAAAQLYRCAAERGHADSQLAYGLLHASRSARKANGVPHSLKKAAYWLEKAARGGSAQGAYELHRLFRRREFSLRSGALAQQYLETAAELGHLHAQFLAGLANLSDRVNHDADVAAAKRLLDAARRGHEEAARLTRVLYRRPPAKFPVADVAPQEAIARAATRRVALAMRLELATAFQLNAQEMLLFDVERSDRGECVLVDIRDVLRRAKRRIIAIESDAERRLLDRARQLLGGAQPHPTDVRGPYSGRKRDFECTLLLLGARPRYSESNYW